MDLLCTSLYVSLYLCMDKCLCRYPHFPAILSRYGPRSGRGRQQPLFTAFYRALLPFTALFYPYCLLLPFTAFARPFTVIYCPLLPFANLFTAFNCPYCLLLPFTAFATLNCLLLPFSVLYCPLLPFANLFTAFYCPLLPFTFFFCPLLPLPLP